MEHDINKIKQIEAFLNGTMTPSESEDFMKEILADDNLRKEVELHRDIRRSFNIQGKKDLKNELNKYYDEHKNVTKSKTIKRILAPVITIAASIIIALLIIKGGNDSSPSENVLTLDSAGINKSPQYADSSTYINENDTIP